MTGRWYAMGVVAAATMTAGAAAQQPAPFGPANPFYAPSTLPFQAPPFDRIRESDYQPALEAGIAEHLKEVQAIANDPAPPTFANTLEALERSGQLYWRVYLTLTGVAQANSTPLLEKVQEEEAPRIAAHDDAISLDAKLFARIETIYNQRESLGLSPEAKRLVEVQYRAFVHAGAKLSPEDKAKLKQINEQESTLENTFRSKLLTAAKDAAYVTADPAALRGLSDAQLSAAAAAAKERGTQGYLLPMQNTTQQPVLLSLDDRTTRQAVFADSWQRAERGGADDTRATILQLAKLRADKAKLLGFDSYAAWALDDQMAKTPDAAIRFMDALVPAATARARSEGVDIQAVIDAEHGGFELEPWDWEHYAEKVRKARYDLDEAQVHPYFELDNVLHNGLFYAATKLYGITFTERTDIPVYAKGVRVFEVHDADGTPLALWYCDYFKRDAKAGGAWEDVFVPGSKLLGTKPVVYNVANFPPPAPGEPALLSFTDVTTMFHEFGHALHSMFADTLYPTISGTQVPRDFVEFPSQFNEHWASYPEVFQHYAKDYRNGSPMPAEMVAKIKRSQDFNQGYLLTELLAAAELDMQWHTLSPSVAMAVKDVDSFERTALEKKQVALKTVPPRYRSSYFLHIWSNGYAAGYYAYLWSEMLDDDAYQWFEEHGGLTRANGDRFRRMVLSRGNTEDLATMYAAWRGRQPNTAAMLKDRGLTADSTAPAK